MRTYSIESSIVAAFESVVPHGERSRAIADAMAARTGVHIKDTKGIPNERLLEQTIVSLTKERDKLNEAVIKLRADFDALMAKYKRFVGIKGGR